MQIFIVGVPKEVKKQEGRVGMTPENVKALISASGGKIAVKVEVGAGLLSGFSDQDYCGAGASLSLHAVDLYSNADMIVKVKELIPEEYYLIPLLHNKVLFTYLHLAGVDPQLTRLLLEHQVTAIAYESVEELVRGKRTFPLLAPMSKIAGTQSMRQAVAHFPQELGYGRLHVVILGGGTVGEAALLEGLAHGICSITVLEIDKRRMRVLRDRYRALLPYRVHIMSMSRLFGKEGRAVLGSADIIISGVMNPGASAPKVLSIAMLSRLRMGTYVADVAIDQGGSTEWSMVTHPGETYTFAGVTFSCVPNIPGSTVPVEATHALTEATYPYIEFLVLAGNSRENGILSAFAKSCPLRLGLQTHNGKLTNEAVAKRHGLTAQYVSVDTVF